MAVELVALTSVYGTAPRNTFLKTILFCKILRFSFLLMYVFSRRPVPTIPPRIPDRPFIPSRPNWRQNWLSWSRDQNSWPELLAGSGCLVPRSPRLWISRGRTRHLSSIKAMEHILQWQSCYPTSFGYKQLLSSEGTRRKTVLE